MRNGPALLFVAAACATAAGCRSDGGLDRHDTLHGLEFASSRVARKTVEDAKDTIDTFDGIPDSVSRSFTDGWRAMRSTYLLYLENHQPQRR